MKYNELLRYRDFLTTAGGLTTATAERYYFAVGQLLHEQNVLSCSDIDVNKVLEMLKTIKYKNTYSLYKNAFLKFCDYQGIAVNSSVSKELEEMSSTKKKKRRKVKPVTLKNIKDKLRVTSDKKLKLSFETMLSTGLRVSELSQIKRNNCVINENDIVLHFVGKGGNHEKVTIEREENKLLYTKLVELVGNTESGDLIFSSAKHLQRNAKAKGFKCHDLRRAYAKVEYKKCRNMNEVSKKLRHSNIKTTKIYLKSNVEIE